MSVWDVLRLLHWYAQCSHNLVLFHDLCLSCVKKRLGLWSKLLVVLRDVVFEVAGLLPDEVQC